MIIYLSKVVAITTIILHNRGMFYKLMEKKMKTYNKLHGIKNTYNNSMAAKSTAFLAFAECTAEQLDSLAKDIETFKKELDK